VRRRETQSFGIANTISMSARLILGGYLRLRHFAVRQQGQGMVEYALILVLVSIVVIVILLTMGKQIRNVFSNVVAALG
jgi:pilus assembly protein Flp/PilA